MGVGVTYSFKDLVGSLINSAFGVSIPLTAGNVGFGKVTIVMDTERTEHAVAADGTVMPSYLAGDNGKAMFEIQQTSALHHRLLALYNLCVNAANNDDVGGWAATEIVFRTVLDGALHTLTGVSFGKLGDKPYEARGQNVTWTLWAANVVNM